MRKPAGGFTMVELIMVIVILGIMAAIALPRFVDLRGDALDTAVTGVASSSGNAAAINYAACTSTNHDRTGANAARCRKVDSCADVGALLMGGILPAGFEVVADSAIGSGSSNGDETDCYIRKIGTVTPTSKFVAYSAGNP